MDCEARYIFGFKETIAPPAFPIIAQALDSPRPNEVPEIIAGNPNTVGGVFEMIPAPICEQVSFGYKVAANCATLGFKEEEITLATNYRPLSGISLHDLFAIINCYVARPHPRSSNRLRQSCCACYE